MGENLRWYNISYGQPLGKVLPNKIIFKRPWRTKLESSLCDRTIYSIRNPRLIIMSWPFGLINPG